MYICKGVSVLVSCRYWHNLPEGGASKLKTLLQCDANYCLTNEVALLIVITFETHVIRWFCTVGDTRYWIWRSFSTVISTYTQQTKWKCWSLSVLFQMLVQSSICQCWCRNWRLFSIAAFRIGRASPMVAQLQPPSPSPNSLDYYLQVHLQSPSITSSKLLHHSLQVRIIMASKCISPNSLSHGLQVHLQNRLIMACKCISKLAPIWPLSTSPNSLHHHLRVHL